jgi:hypothetical protein
MADIKITDEATLTADLNISDTSPLAKAKLSQLVPTGKQLFGDFDKPIDQADEQSVALGGTFNSPNFLSGDLDNLVAGAGMNCGQPSANPQINFCSRMMDCRRSSPLPQTKRGSVLSSTSQLR